VDVSEVMPVRIVIDMCATVDNLHLFPLFSRKEVKRSNKRKINLFRRLHCLITLYVHESVLPCIDFLICVQNT